MVLSRCAHVMHSWCGAGAGASALNIWGVDGGTASSIHGLKVILKADIRWADLEGESGRSCRRFSWTRPGSGLLLPPQSLGQNLVMRPHTSSWEAEKCTRGMNPQGKNGFGEKPTTTASSYLLSLPHAGTAGRRRPAGPFVRRLIRQDWPFPCAGATPDDPCSPGCWPAPASERGSPESPPIPVGC